MLDNAILWMTKYRVNVMRLSCAYWCDTRIHLILPAMYKHSVSDHSVFDNLHLIPVAVPWQSQNIDTNAVLCSIFIQRRTYNEALPPGIDMTLR